MDMIAIAYGGTYIPEGWNMRLQTHVVMIVMEGARERVCPLWSTIVWICHGCMMCAIRQYEQAL